MQGSLGASPTWRSMGPLWTWLVEGCGMCSNARQLVHVRGVEVCAGAPLWRGTGVSVDLLVEVCCVTEVGDSAMKHTPHTHVYTCMYTPLTHVHISHTQLFLPAPLLPPSPHGHTASHQHLHHLHSTHLIRTPPPLHDHTHSSRQLHGHQP